MVDRATKFWLLAANIVAVGVMWQRFSATQQGQDMQLQFKASHTHQPRQHWPSKAAAQRTLTVAIRP